MAAHGEILVVPFHDPGHVFPATELSSLLASSNFLVTLLLPPSSSSSPPPHPLIRTLRLSLLPDLPPPPHPPPHGPHPPPHGPRPPPGPGPSGPHPFPAHHEAQFRALLSRLAHDRPPTSPPFLLAVIDAMLSHLLPSCRSLGVPAVSLFTSSACSLAFELATWRASDASPAQLPEEVTALLAANDRPRHLVGPPRGLSETNDAAALLFNTCDGLERPFLEYIAREAKKPVWAVGPLLPVELWSAAETGGAPALDGASRRLPRESSHAERDVLAWLDARPPRSVVYVSFGTVASPAEEDLVELAAGLEESGRPFIWAVQLGRGPSAPPEELGKRVGESRGLVIRGWAPQLLILSHQATGGFLTHCGWNSTAEALLCGVPMLAWPLRGDQFANARLVARWLRAGHELRPGGWEGQEATVMRGEVARGIEQLMADEGARERAAAVARGVFGGGFPASSTAALDALLQSMAVRKVS